MYIKPPRGDIQLIELQECVTTRFQYFMQKYKSEVITRNTSLKIEYLSLGTALDRVGHFTLRLLAAHSEELREFIASSEASFLVERLEFSTSKQIIRFLNSTLRHLEEENSSASTNKVWRKESFEILNHMKCAFKFSHFDSFNHDDKCSQFLFKVPFFLCLKMVAKRELHLEKGSVIVPCGKWKPFLNCFFEAFFNKEIFNMRSSQVVQESVTDARLTDLRNIIMSLFNRKILDFSDKGNVKSNEIGELKKLFPPCMDNFYSSLRTNHRLSHSARFNFSLFLKDIGMPLNESIEFWRYEYSKPSMCGSKCSHSWQKNSAKYTYSIRHLYGLEGKRANYHAPSCARIQKNHLGPIEEGGCPFSTFDAKKLKVSLDSTLLAEEDKEMIMYLKSNDQSKACDYYRKALLKRANVENSCSITIVHQSPVEYFNLMRKDLSNKINKK